MMEPPASIARWSGDNLTLWTSSQMVDWHRTDLALTLRIPKENIRVVSSFIGGGFGGKLFLRAEALLAAMGARAAGRTVKVAMPRPMIFNNATHRPATIQRIRIGADNDGRIVAIAQERHLRLILVEGQFRVLALAGKHRRGRLARSRHGHKHAVLRVVVRSHREHELLAVFGDLEVFLAQAGDGFVAAFDDDDVDDNRLGAGLEYGNLSLSARGERWHIEVRPNGG